MPPHTVTDPTREAAAGGAAAAAIARAVEATSPDPAPLPQRRHEGCWY